MDRKKIVAALIFISLAACSRKPVIRVGAKNFTEQSVLGEIIAQHLEHRLNQKVERHFNLGGTLLAHQAITNNQIDLYPEYTGTALTSVLKDPVATDSSLVLERVRQEYRRIAQIEWLNPLGINNTFVMVIRGEDARSRHLETLSDAAQVTPGWALGVGYEFQERPDGQGALMSAYRLPQTAAPKSMDLGLLYTAIQQKKVDMIAANATDGVLSKLDLKILKDDKNAFPPYQACIEVRQDALQTFPGLRAALDELSAKFTNETMQKLNYEVDGDHRQPREVAAGFLRTLK